MSKICMCVLHLYSGKDEALATDHGVTHAVVMRLVDPIKQRGHHVYLDNYYTSPRLFSDLNTNGFGVCGTVRLDRRGLPPSMKSMKKNMRKGEKVSSSRRYHYCNSVEG